MTVIMERQKITKVQEWRLRQMRKSRIRDHQARELMLYNPLPLIPPSPWKPPKP